MSEQRDLFGGAITANLPRCCIDASDIRQVPDTQEVFLYPDSGISIILEILERVDSEDNQEAAKLHFDSLAHDNSAQLATVESTSIIVNDRGDNTPSPVVLSGIQIVQKFNRQFADRINIFMALYRVVSKRIDLVLTMNIPVDASGGDAVGEHGLSAAKSDFNAVATSLRIVDYGLFA